MKTMSGRDLRQRWPEAEALLQVEHEIIITGDGPEWRQITCFSRSSAISAAP